MPDDLKTTIAELANSLQTITLLSAQLHRALAQSAKDSIDLEAAADQAVRAIKRLQPSRNG